jgi:hypothetical protein
MFTYSLSAPAGVARETSSTFTWSLARDNVLTFDFWLLGNLQMRCSVVSMTWVNKHLSTCSHLQSLYLPHTCSTAYLHISSKHTMRHGMSDGGSLDSLNQRFRKWEQRRSMGSKLKTKLRGLGPRANYTD